MTSKLAAIMQVTLYYTSYINIIHIIGKKKKKSLHPQKFENLSIHRHLTLTAALSLSIVGKHGSVILISSFSLPIP